jgi:S-adenosylmethionine hydrolase
VAGGSGVLIGPDNGLLAPAVAMAGGAERAVELVNPEYRLPTPGATFAGRDIFAPAAGHLCNGVELDELGPEVDTMSLMPATVPVPRDDGDTIVAEVLWVDRFGNCQLNVGPDDLPDAWTGDVQVRVLSSTDPDGGAVRRAGRVESFAAISPGQAGLVLDSYGMLAICLNRRSASEELGLIAGDQVQLAALDGSVPGTTTSVSFGRRQDDR